MNESKRKKIHVVEDTCFVIIDKGIVEKLQLKREDAWTEQSVVEDGILLRIIHKGESTHG